MQGHLLSHGAPGRLSRRPIQHRELRQPMRVPKFRPRPGANPETLVGRPVYLARK
jgi:hypothetical protein